MTENSTTSTEVLRLERKIEILELEQKRRDLEVEKRQAPKPWWTSAIEFLALPAAIIAIVVQLTGALGTVTEQEKTKAETEKIRTEEVKTRAELQGIVDDLAEKKRKGVESYRSEVEKALPQLESTLAKLKSINTESDKAVLQTILPKYILLWIAFHAVGLLADVISQIWSAMLSSVAIAIFTRRRDKKLTRAQELRWRTIERGTQWSVAILGPAPNILRWSIQLSLFVALMIPLFDETAHLLGSSFVFEDLLDSAKSADLQGILLKLQNILFKAGS